MACLSHVTRPNITLIDLSSPDTSKDCLTRHPCYGRRSLNVAFHLWWYKAKKDQSNVWHSTPVVSQKWHITSGTIKV